MERAARLTKKRERGIGWAPRISRDHTVSLSPFFTIVVFGFFVQPLGRNSLPDKAGVPRPRRSRCPSDPLGSGLPGDPERRCPRSERFRAGQRSRRGEGLFVPPTANDGRHGSDLCPGIGEGAKEDRYQHLPSCSKQRYETCRDLLPQRSPAPAIPDETI